MSVDVEEGREGSSIRDEITAAGIQMVEMATKGNVLVCVSAHLNGTRMRLEFLSEEVTLTSNFSLV